MKFKAFSLIMWFGAALLALPLLTACDSDTDSNPTFQEASSFVLNESAYATNNTINLAADGTVVSLTCNQPDYGGFPVATVYTVLLSFDSSMSVYAAMTTTFTSTAIDIDASEMNSTLLELWTTTYGDDVEVSTDPVAVYVQLTALVSGQEIGYCESNIICLPSVLMTTTVTSVDLPEHMYLAGSHNGWVFDAMGSVNGLEGQYYQVIYLESGGSFKFGTKDQDWRGIDDENLTITYSGSFTDNSDNNIMPDNAGWYTVFIKVTTSGGDYVFNMTLTEAAVYLIAPTADGAWAVNDDWLFTDSGNATLISPAIDASGELRMAVYISGLDWWRTEFTLKDGSEIYFRDDADIPSNWAEDVGSEYSVTVSTGDVVELDFNNLTGSVQ